MAGPGSGKTFVLVERIRYLIETKHFPPSSILVLTFSKAAALEMKGRFGKLTNKRYQEVVFGTFHSVFFRILLESSADRLSIISPSEQLSLIKHLINCYEKPEKAENEILADSASSAIAYIKSNLKESSSQFITDHDRLHEIIVKNSYLRSVSRSFSSPYVLAGICGDYDKFLSENSKIDFEDMILRCRMLLESEPDVLHKWQDKFRHILVDEFQDINSQQYKIIRLISGDNDPDLFAVGDDDQSIYGFRGSDPAVMRLLKEDYESLQQILLDINYRCSEEITSASLSVISENKNRFVKQIKAFNKGGEPIKIVSLPEEKDEYDYLCHALRSYSPAELSDSAVIFRNHAQAASLCTRLQNEGIKYRRRGAAPDRIRKEITKDVISYLNLANLANSENACSRPDMYRVMNIPQRYISREAIAGNIVCFDKVIRYYSDRKYMSDIITVFIDDLRCMAHLRPKLAIRFMRKSIGYENAVMSGKSMSVRSRISAVLDEIEEKAGKTSSHKELISVMEESPAEKSDRSIGSAGDNDNSGVSVITMHASKGLEFGRVFLPDLNEGIIPSRKIRDEAGIEEERRLLYVAMTRAKKMLTLIYIDGTKENPRKPSRFLKALGVIDHEEGQT